MTEHWVWSHLPILEPVLKPPSQATQFNLIGHLHDNVILLLRPESFGFFLSCANYRLCYLNLAGITKFKCERKNEKNSGRNRKMTPSCKWPISPPPPPFHPWHFIPPVRCCSEVVVGVLIWLWRDSVVTVCWNEAVVVKGNSRKHTCFYFKCC